MTIKTATEKRIHLKDIMLSCGCTPVPGVYDALGAKLAQSAGFDAIYLGSFSTAVSVIGEPDVGSVTMTEMVSHVRNVANSVDTPLIVDVENGFSHAAHIWRTVQEMELAGAAAIRIEDHEFGKHTKLPPVILEVNKMCNKIKAAVQARKDPNMLIIARTDVAWAHKDPKEMRDAVNGPVIVPGSEESSVAQETEKGLNISLYWPMLLNASFVAMREALAAFKKSGNYASLGKYVVPENELNRYIGYDEYLDRAETYLL